MRAFAELFRHLDETTQSLAKIAALKHYFSNCAPGDGAWAVHFLSGRKLPRLVPVRQLRQACRESTGLPEWIFDECYDSVGDLSETIALLLPVQDTHSSGSLADWVENTLRPMAKLGEAERTAQLRAAWQQLSRSEVFVFNKLVTGGFRVGVSQGLVVKALAQVADLPPATITHRLMGTWEPTAEFFTQLLAPESAQAARSHPYPFCLANPLTQPVASLGPISDWKIEWKWDGLRAQLIRRQGQTFLWSRGEELMTERFPELTEVAPRLPEGTVLDGEIVGWKNARVLPFTSLQKRIGRKKLSPKILAEVPVRFLAFDLLETSGVDCRTRPLFEREEILDQILAELPEQTTIARPPQLFPGSWEEAAQIRETSRDQQAEGLMLKRRDSEYGVGRPVGSWWKWKVAPFTCEAVLIYAQKGHGRRASLYTDYTFAVWDQGQLVPIAKAYSGLTDAEIVEVDRFIRQNTLERFGPIRSVKPELVFELAFENIQLSSRHKSGLAVRFPRMLRWRLDKTPAEADTLEAIQKILAGLPTS